MLIGAGASCALSSWPVVSACATKWRVEGGFTSRGGGATGGAGGATEVASFDSMGPVPFSNHDNVTSGKPSLIFWTTSKLGLLRPLRIWLTMGLATPMRSAN